MQAVNARSISTAELLADLVQSLGRRRSSAETALFRAFDGQGNGQRTTDNGPGYSSAPADGTALGSDHDLHDLRFLLLQGRVDLLDVLVRELLDLGEGVLLVVLADVVVLEQLLQVLVRVAAHVADGDAALLGVLVGDLHEVLAALLRQRRHRDPDDLAVVLRVEVEVGGADGLLDRGEERGVPGLERDERRVGDGQVADLVERGGRPVVVHADHVEHRDRRPAGPHRPQLAEEGVHGAPHAALRVDDHLLERHRYSLTRVPIVSPVTTRRRFPLRLRS